MKYMFMNYRSTFITFMYGFLTASVLSGMYIYHMVYDHTLLEYVSLRCMKMQMENNTKIFPHEGRMDPYIGNTRIVMRYEKSDIPGVNSGNLILYRLAGLEIPGDKLIYQFFPKCNSRDQKIDGSRYFL